MGNKISVQKQGLGLRFVEDILKVMGSQSDVEGKEDGPDLRDAIVGLEESMAVVSQIGDSIPFLNPCLQKAIGEPVDPFSVLQI
jgi:hypothetical protein